VTAGTMADAGTPIGARAARSETNDPVRRRRLGCLRQPNLNCRIVSVSVRV